MEHLGHRRFVRSANVCAVHGIRDPSHRERSSMFRNYTTHLWRSNVRRMRAAEGQIIHVNAFATPHNQRLFGLRSLWPRRIILHRMLVLDQPSTEGRSRNREPDESQQRFARVTCFTRFKTATSTRISDWRTGRADKTCYARIDYEQRNELPAAVGARQCLTGGTVVSANAQHTQCFSERNRLARDGRISATELPNDPQLAGVPSPQMRSGQSVTRRYV